MGQTDSERSISTSDGKLYVTNFTVDRQMSGGGDAPNGLAVVIRQTDKGPVRRNMREEDFMQMADSGTPDEKKFANRAMARLQEYEADSSKAGTFENLSIPRPDISQAASVQPSAALAINAPSR